MQRWMGTCAAIVGVFVMGCDGGGGTLDASNVDAVTGESGRMVGITAAHNAHRAMVAATPPLAPLVWDAELAAGAEAHSRYLATNGCGLEHSDTMLGENLYWQIGAALTPEEVVGGWYAEVACYTFGPFMGGDACDMTCTDRMSASGCGHYTQVVWRDTQRVGCGLAICESGAEIWTCRYDPAGNYLGQPPY